MYNKQPYTTQPIWFPFLSTFRLKMVNNLSQNWEGFADLCFVWQDDVVQVSMRCLLGLIKAVNMCMGPGDQHLCLLYLRNQPSIDIWLFPKMAPQTPFS